MDLLLRDASLIDGTGAPARPADVAVTGDRIAAVAASGRAHAGCRTPRSSTSTASSLAPGFIDIHTHYDAQILWDGDLTPSSWHGVTSVVMGNCGFGVAPTRPEHRDTIVRTFENVEGMSMEALNDGHRLVLRDVPRVPRRARRGAASASTSARSSATPPLRLFVLGGEERPATDDEVATMRELLREAMRGRGDRVLDVAASRTTRARSAGRCRAASPSVDEVYALAVGARRARQGRRRGVDRARAVRRPVLRAGGALRRARHVDGARGAGRQAGRRAAHGRARRRAARRGVPADRLPADRHADQPGRPVAARRDRRVEGGARRARASERAALYRDAVVARPGPPDDRSPRGATGGRRSTSRRPSTHHDLVGIPLDAARRRARHDAVRPHARPRARRRPGHPVPGRHGQRRRRRDRRPARRQAHAARPLRRRAPTPASSATPATRPTCSGTGCASARRSRSRMRCGASPATRTRRSASPTAGSCARASTPTWSRSTPTRSARTPVERVHDQPGGADRLVVRSTGVEHMWVNGVATRVAGEEVAGVGPGRVLRS